MDFEKLYNAYYMKVYSYVLTMIKNSHLAEEITQKTFFKAMNAANKFRKQSEEFTYLCAIAKNLVYDEMRHYKHFGDSEGETPDNMDIERMVETEDSMLRIHQILHMLEEPYKEVFQLRIFGELSFKNIGIIFEKTENWARVTYHRARLKILERMDEE